MEIGLVQATAQPVSYSIASTASLLCLGNDLLLSITDYIDSERSINALARTNRRLHFLLINYLYRHNVLHGNSSALRWAAQHGLERSAAMSVAQGAELESKEDRYRRTPLALAAERGRDAVVKLLLEAGAELEPQDISKQSPLDLAAGGGHAAVVKMLLRPGVHIDQRHINQRIPWNLGPLYPAVKNGHAAVVKLLIEAGANIEVRDCDGRTPLSWAAATVFRAAPPGDVTIVKLLLDAGAQLERRDIYGRTPLSWAKREGRRDVVKLLLDAGAQNLDKNGQQPFQFPKAASSILRRLSMVGRR